MFLDHYMSSMLCSVHCLPYILYIRSFGTWICSRLQAIGCCYTDCFCSISVLVTMVGIEPGPFNTSVVY
jgi:hypothetical protein